MYILVKLDKTSLRFERKWVYFLKDTVICYNIHKSSGKD